MILRALRNRLLLAPALATLVVVGTLAGRAEERAALPQGPLSGVRHAIYAAVRFDPASPYLNRDSARATVTALLRISDHAREANFFGMTIATFVDFAVTEAPPPLLVWQDAACHQNRGAPKIAVISLDGLVKTGGSEETVSARPRHLGQPLPGDEIVPAQGFTFGADRLGRFALEPALTSQSRIRVEVKLYTETCDI